MNFFDFFVFHLLLYFHQSYSFSIESMQKSQVLGPWWTNKKILNSSDKTAALTSGNSEEKLVSLMRKTMLRLKGEFMREDGSSVDYAGIRQSDLFKEYVGLAKELDNCSVLNLSVDERKAFFINIYNTLVIHALVENLLSSFPGGSLSRLQMYAKASYTIAGFPLCLNDIENGILRGNRPSAAPLSRKPFYEESDPRKPLILECDPRIHFALNCGAKSCPPISVYPSEGLDATLDRVTKSFLADNVVISEDKSTIQLSMLFKWYRIDFGDDDVSVLRWIQLHAPDNLANEISTVLSSATMPKLEYATYDWGING